MLSLSPDIDGADRRTGGAKPTKYMDAIGRREVGKVAWRGVINDLIDSEREDLDALKILRSRLSDTDSLRLVGGLLERKAERVIELTLLLRYRDREKERELGNGTGGE